MMDPMEEFEFRPITEGLGFHQKNAEKNIEKKSASNPLPPIENLGLKQDIYESKASVKVPMAPAKALFSEPLLPRTEPITKNQTQAVTQTTSAPIDVPMFRGPKLSNPAEARKPAIDTKKEINIAAVLEKANVKAPRKTFEETRVQTQEVAPSFLSIFLDFTVIAGLSILFMLALSIATQMDLVMIFRGVGTDTGAIAALALLIYSVAQFYMILSRSFFGQTLGEWSMDSQIGTSEQQSKLSYVFRLVLRTWVLAITGMIVLPIISAITQKDVAGSISGLKLYRR